MRQDYINNIIKKSTEKKNENPEDIQGSGTEIPYQYIEIDQNGKL